MKLRFRFGLCSLLLGLSLCCASPRAHAATLTVCPSGTPGQNGCQYIGGSGIQAAIDAIPDGTTSQPNQINLTAGTYNNVEIQIGTNSHPVKKYIKISGNSAETTILDNGNLGHVMFIAQDSIVTLEKIHLRNAQGSGLISINAARVTIQNNHLTDNVSAGIAVRDNSQAIITNNTIHGNQSQGIYLGKSATATITNNTIHGNQTQGIYLGDSATATITNNTIAYNVMNGLYCGVSSSCYVTNNISSNNGDRGIIGEHNYNLKRLTYNNSSTNGGDNFDSYWDPNQLTAWGNVKLKPLFVSETDFHLQPGSPGINIGDPALLDPDGSRSDMGAYGGPGAPGSPTPTPTINPSPPPTACNAACTLDAQCGQATLFCRALYTWPQWQNVSSNVASMGSGVVTSFAVRDNNGIQEQHLVKGGQIWYREGGIAGWSAWENVTHYLENVGSGTITSFKAYTAPEEMVEQYFVRGGKIWYQQRRSTWSSGFQDVTSNVNGVGSGTITSFSSYLAQGSQIHQHLVRDGKIYTHDNIRGWSAPWQEVTSNMNGVGDGPIASFTAQIIDSKLDQYLVRNGALYYRSATFNNGACRLRTNPSSDTCMDVPPPTSTPPPFPSPTPTPGFSPSPPPPLIADYNGDGVVNLLDLNLAKQRIAQGTFTIFHYNNVIQALLQ